MLLIVDVVKKPIFHNGNTHIKPRVFRILNDLTVLAKLPPFPQEKLADCKIFGDEWRERKISKQEFADALEQLLSELP